jgi:primase-like protein/bifunctional DNA primase/polymerase-like protein
MTPIKYGAWGWCLKPVPAGQKRPIIKGWPNREFDPADFANGVNIAVRLGKHSRDLVDCDLDCEEAIELAPLYLPETRAIFGRKSAPRSHWLYIAVGAQFETFVDPVAQQTLLELRADGRDGGAHITLVPPSIADGEQREWCGDTIDPAVFDGRALRICMARLAIGSLVMRYVSEYAARRPGPDLLDVLWEFDHELGRPAYRWLNKSTPDAPRWVPKPRHLLSDHEVTLRELAQTIPNSADWHEWNRLGMAFFAASDGSDEGFIAFDTWSAKSPKYDPHALEERWHNYRRSPPSRIGLGTLVHLARLAGWKPERAR